MANENLNHAHDPLDDPEEQRVLMRALDSYGVYRRRAHYNSTHIRRQSFYALPQAHWELLAQAPISLLDTLSAVDDAIDANADIADAIVRAAQDSFLPPGFAHGSVNDGGGSGLAPWDGLANSSDVEKARSTLRQFYRDWSAEGATERDACYTPVLNALKHEFAAVQDLEKSKLNILVPGAGLGRLLLEVVLAGFSAEGNEISYHQLLASSFILNHTDPAKPYPLYPWALSFSNHVSRAHQLQRVLIPDLHPALALSQAASEGRNGQMGFSTGDFCMVYNDPEHAEAYDAVASVFFIDTAPNLIRYVEAVHNCLRAGGIWINLGPLLWHFENTPPGGFYDHDHGEDQQGTSSTKAEGIGEAGSFELSDEEVVHLVTRFGFTIEKHEVGVLSSGYIQNPQSMQQNFYRPSFWIARKQ